MKYDIKFTISHQIIKPITASISTLNTLTVTLQNNPIQIQESSKQTIQSLNESIIQIVVAIIMVPVHKFYKFKINIVTIYSN